MLPFTFEWYWRSARVFGCHKETETQRYKQIFTSHLITMIIKYSRSCMWPPFSLRLLLNHWPTVQSLLYVCKTCFSNWDDWNMLPVPRGPSTLGVSSVNFSSKKGTRDADWIKFDVQLVLLPLFFASAKKERKKWVFVYSRGIAGEFQRLCLCLIWNS